MALLLRFLVKDTKYMILLFNACLNTQKNIAYTPGALTLSTLCVAPWLKSRRCAARWGVPLSELSWLADRFGLDCVRGGLGARGMGTGPHGNRLSTPNEAECIQVHYASTNDRLNRHLLNLYMNRSHELSPGKTCNIPKKSVLRQEITGTINRK